MLNLKNTSKEANHKFLSCRFMVWPIFILMCFHKPFQRTRFSLMLLLLWINILAYTIQYISSVSVNMHILCQKIWLAYKNISFNRKLRHPLVCACNCFPLACFPFVDHFCKNKQMKKLRTIYAISHQFYKWWMVRSATINIFQI